MNVMTVDDSLVVRKLITNILSSLGYNTVQAENGQEAVDYLSDEDRKASVGLILLDWNMPIMDGYEFLTKLRGDLNSSIPVIMVTTEAEKGKVIKAIQAGANHYLIKPFTPEELSLRIMQVLG